MTFISHYPWSWYLDLYNSIHLHGMNEYSYDGSQLIYQSQQVQGLLNGSSSASANAFGGSFVVVNSMASWESPLI